jgi:hypothetical protein
MMIIITITIIIIMLTQWDILSGRIAKPAKKIC